MERNPPQGGPPDGCLGTCVPRYFVDKMGYVCRESAVEFHASFLFKFLVVSECNEMKGRSFPSQTGVIPHLSGEGC